METVPKYYLHSSTITLCVDLYKCLEPVLVLVLVVLVPDALRVLVLVLDIFRHQTTEEVREESIPNEKKNKK